MRAALDLLGGELGEPALDEVEPARPGRGEVEVKRGWRSSQRLMAGVLWVA